jgi:putative ABC transport system substrate-binding protein
LQILTSTTATAGRINYLDGTWAPGNDPVQYGLVASFNRPGGNVTGVNDIGVDLGAKRLGLLHELLPGASRFAALVDPTNQATESTVAEVTAAASAIGRSIDVVTASTNREIDTAFASLVQKRIDALWVRSFRVIQGGGSSSR